MKLGILLILVLTLAAAQEKEKEKEIKPAGPANQVGLPVNYQQANVGAWLKS
jgi:hypothetical protein